MQYSDNMEVGKNKMDLSEALIYPEDLEVSGDSDSKSDIEINHQDWAKVFIQSPIGANGNISDIDLLPLLF